MFKKILIANRGEIAARIVRACRELGIASLALYEPPDRDSLHVRLADECAPLDTPGGFMDGAAILALARARGADAIHPGYGYLAERADFIRDCAEAGITFIGPPAEVVESVRDKISALGRARAAGIPTVVHSPVSFDETDLAALRAHAETLGYPIVVKSCSGGRGRGERWITRAERLEEAVRRAQAEAQTVYGSRRVYLERAVPSAHQIGVQILGDRRGQRVWLDDREGSIMLGNQKLIEESPAPCLNDAQRAQVRQYALVLADLFQYENAGTVEFLVDAQGQLQFTEIKARIQMEHPVTEYVAQVDMVREQIRIANGEPLSLRQEEVHLRGCAIQCRVSAEDPWNDLMPSTGVLQQVRLPSGPGVRVDTYVYAGYEIPGVYDSLLAKLVVWDTTREGCVARLQRALDEFYLGGTPTNVPYLKHIVREPDFVRGTYTTDFYVPAVPGAEVSSSDLRDLAIAAAVVYLRRNQAQRPVLPERLLSGWHRSSRALN